jgi:lysylphosphatidylglycerol synthetase-like protein (DUF2156 family)
MGEEDRRERIALRVAAALGLAAGLFVVISFAVAAVPEIAEEGLDGIRVLILLTAALVQIVSAAALMWALARFLIQWRIKLLWSIPVGALAGAVAGGLCGGITIATLFGLGIPAGLIDVGPEAWARTWYGTIGYTFAAGGAFGALTGLPFGAIGAPLLNYWLNYRGRGNRPS